MVGKQSTLPLTFSWICKISSTTKLLALITMVWQGWYGLQHAWLLSNNDKSHSSSLCIHLNTTWLLFYIICHLVGSHSSYCHFISVTLVVFILITNLSILQASDTAILYLQILLYSTISFRACHMLQYFLTTLYHIQYVENCWCGTRLRTC